MKSAGNVPKVFLCEICDYKCSKQSILNKHLSTPKHLKAKNGLIKATTGEYICEKCQINFKHQSSYCRHKKKCVDDDSKTEKDEMFHLLLTQNKELMNIIKDGIIVNNNNTTTNTNSHNTTNNAFNLNFFLNETCKDAMNINEFVSSIKVSLADLENTGRQGYIEGITNIILKNLNNLKEDSRPLHCSDSKREVFYIKDNNEWQKENQEKPILTKAIKVIANENIKQIKCWRDKYPDCTDSDSQKNNLYLKIVSNSMNGSTAEESIKNIDKIISNVAKEVIIDKTNL